MIKKSWLRGELGCLALIIGCSAAAADAYEPNNRIQDATSLNEGVVQQHSLSIGLFSSDTTDWMRFSVASTTNVVVTVEDAAPLSLLGLISSSNVPTVNLFDSGQNTVEIAPQRSESGHVARSTLQATLSPGVYYVKAEIPGSLLGLSSLSYFVSFKTSPVADDAFEDDDIFQLATPIALGETQSGHSLNPIGDVDVFRFTLTERVHAGISTANTVIVDGEYGVIELTLFDSNGGYLAGGASVTAYLEAGTYYIVAECPDRLVLWYGLALSDLSQPDAYEVDDTREEARILPLNGSPQLHTLHHPEDVDWVAVYAPSNSLELVLDAGLSVRDLNVALFHLVGGTLTFVDGVLNETTSLLGGLLGINLTIQLPQPGVYFIRVHLPKGVYDSAKSTSAQDTHYTIAAKSYGAQVGSIVGVVSDNSNSPVVDARVAIDQLSGMHTRSDEDGVYVFPSVPTGTHTVRSTKEDYADGVRNVEVTPYGIAQADFTVAVTNPPVLSIAATNATVPEDGGTAEVVISNEGGLTLNWEATVRSGGSWLTLNRATGAAGESLRYTVAANAGSARQGTIEVRSPQTPDQTLYLVVSQEAKHLPPPPPPEPNDEGTPDEDESGDTPPGEPQEPPVAPEPVEPVEQQFVCITPAIRMVEGPSVLLSGSVSAATVQAVINAVTGKSASAYDCNGDGVVDAVDVQLVVRAALGLDN